MNNRPDTYSIYLPWWGKVNARSLFLLLIGALLAFFFLYVGLVRATVSHVIARSNAERSMSSISGQLGDMESRYLALENAITLQVAYQDGFIPTATSQFVSKTQSLSYNYNH